MFGVKRDMALLILCSIFVITVCATMMSVERKGTANVRVLGELFEAASETKRAGYGKLDSYDYYVPLEVLDYSNGLTAGEFEQRLRALASRPEETLSKRLNFADFVQWVAVSYLADDTRYERVAINGEFSPGTLAILIVDRKFMPDAHHFEIATCAFFGGSVIVCDLDKLVAALARIEGYDENMTTVLGEYIGSATQLYRVNFVANLSDLQALLRQNFITWVIGHEVAHAVLHAGEASAGRPLHFDYRYDEREKQADLFVMDRLRATKALDAGFTPLLLEFVEQELEPIRSKRREDDMTSESGDTLIVGSRQEEALLARAFNMLVTAVKREPATLSRMQFRRIGKDFGFVHSVKLAPYVRELDQRIVMERSGYDRNHVIWVATAILALLVVVILGCIRKRA